jgi:hypothetical protein
MEKETERQRRTQLNREKRHFNDYEIQLRRGHSRREDEMSFVAMVQNRRERVDEYLMGNNSY